MVKSADIVVKNGIGKFTCGDDCIFFRDDIRPLLYVIGRCVRCVSDT